MKELFLVKYGELALKRDNRHLFEKRLLADIRTKLDTIDPKIVRKRGRIFLSCDEQEAKRVSKVLSQTFGLVSFARALRVKRDMPSIEKAAITLGRKWLEGEKGHRFKIEARRANKGFPLTSYQIACRLGDILRSHLPQLKVDLYHPDWILNVEVRDSVYLYGPEVKAPGGLPLGCNGKGLLLLSGGIDSPVAGYLMGKRGLEIDAVYFHAPPFTSPKAQEKVERLTEIISAYLTEITLYVIPFTNVQLRIKERSYNEELTLLMRACMMQIAEKIALKNDCNCLVTGESLGQVASQTPESLRFTGSVTTLPVFRPLIGMDKQEIVRLAKAIGTYETSILPFEDCCTLFVPSHPLIRPGFQRMTDSYKSLEVKELADQAVQGAKTVSFPPVGH